MFNWNSLLEIIKVLVTLAGAVFALFQWWKSNNYKRAELVQKLMEKVRDDEEISELVLKIDYSTEIRYNGDFLYEGEPRDSIKSQELMTKIDKTLAYYSYICYLKKQKILKDEDILIFDYTIKRLTTNPHMANYLYSLYHWSNSIKINCSFDYLIKYAERKGYIKKQEFERLYEDGSEHVYECYLRINETYRKRNLISK